MGMDPISLAASIAGLISLAGQIISAGYAISARLERNADEVRAVTNEVAIFSGVVLGVKARLPSTGSTLPDSMKDIPKAIKECEDSFQEISKLLDKLGRSNRLTLVLVGEGREQRLKDLVHRIQHYKTYFILFFQLENTSHTDAVRRRMAEVLTNLDILIEGQKRAEAKLDRLVGIEELHRREKMINWLGTPTQAIHDDLREQRDEDSATWIIDRKPEFGNWLSASASSFFWLSGTHGSGKSIVVSRIIDVIQERCRDENSTRSSQTQASGVSALAYHYCRFSNQDSLSPTKMLGSLVAQLLIQCPKLDVVMPSVKNLYDSHQRTFSFPKLGELKGLLGELSKIFGQIFLVVDGLDEMPDRFDVLDFLGGLSEGDGVFKVLVASRAKPDLTQAFSYYNTVTISPEDLADDIDRYVKKRIRRMDLPAEEKEEIVKQLVSQANGMFLWVHYQLEQLSRIATMITPEMLPRSLEKIFTDTFAKMDYREKTLAKRILQFVMFSRRPLSLEELVEGIAIKANCKTRRDIQTNKIRKDSDVFEICQSLVRKSHSTERIELSHYSVYEFLNSPVLEDGRQNEYYLTKAESVPHILTSCIKYLDMDGVCQPRLAMEIERALETESKVDKAKFSDVPYLDYAAINWTFHVEEASPVQLEELWGPVIVPFLKSTQHLEFWALTARYHGDAYRSPRDLSPLHICASRGLESLAERMLGDPEYSQTVQLWSRFSSDGRTPLHMAAENGFDGMIRILSVHGAAWNIDAMDGEGRTALHIAVETGNEKTVKQLITAGADANVASRIDGRTPVSIAIENSWDQVAGLLSEKASLSTRLSDGRGLLHLAAQTGSSIWIEALLGAQGPERSEVDQYAATRHPNYTYDARQDPADEDEVFAPVPLSSKDETDENGWTPLHYAVDRGHEDIALDLVRRGVYIAIEDKTGWTPLHAAIHHKNMECARLLLTSRNPLRPSVPGPVGSRGARARAQHAAHLREMLQEGGPNEARLLARKYGVAVENVIDQSNIEEPQAPSPLRIAVMSGYIEGIRLLLHSERQLSKDEVGCDEMDKCIEKAIERTKAESTEPAASRAVDILSELLRVALADEQMSTQILPELLSLPGSLLYLVHQEWTSEFVHQRLLIHTIRESSAQVTEFLLAQWPPSSETLPHDIMYQVALYWHDEMHCISRLISGGANIGYVNYMRQSVVELAIDQRSWELAALLLGQPGVDLGPAPGRLLNAIVKTTGTDEAEIGRGLRLVEMLQSMGVEIAHRDRSGQGICHKAAARADSRFLAWALGQGADPAEEDFGGLSPVHAAVKAQQFINVQLLLEKIVISSPRSMLRVLSQGGSGKSTLVAATDSADTAMLQSLVEADQATRLSVNWSSEEIAARKTVYADALCNVIEKQLEEGFNILMINMEDIDWPGSNGETPLLVAARGSEVVFVKSLLENGADPRKDVFRGTVRLSPFTVALEAEQPRMLDAFRAYGVGPQPEHLLRAAARDDISLVDEITDIYSHDTERQRRALYEAREDGREAVMSLLRDKHGHQLEGAVEGLWRDAFGDTELHAAVRIGDQVQVMRVLDGSQARAAGSLRDAERYPRRDLLKQRLIEARDLGGLTALMLAVKMEKWACAQVIAGDGGNVAETVEWVASLEEVDGEKRDTWLRRLAWMLGQ